MITAFLSVFESKLSSIKKKLKNELDKPRKDRNKKFLKDLLKEAKNLKKTIKAMRRETSCFCTCPKCGEMVEFKIDKEEFNDE